MKNLKSKALALVASVAALASVSTAAQAHLVTFGWLDNGDGTTTVFGEHWHGDLSYAYSDNGGLHISDGVNTATVQWAGTVNNVSIAGMNFTGWASTNTGSSNAYQDWFYTAPLALGNGTYNFYTGPNCCVDEMDDGPVQITITGVTSSPPGIGGVPEPGTWALLMTGVGLTGAMMRRRKAAAATA
jgi:hypothetical protein